MNQLQRLFEFRDVTDHGQHDAQVAITCVGLEHGAHLGQENLRVIQRHANAAPAEEGVVFGYRKVRQGLVAADIQCAHGHRARREGRELLAVDQPLLFLTGETVTQKKRHFRPVQADALRPLLERARDIGHQAGVDPERQAVTIHGFAGQLAQGLEVA